MARSSGPRIRSIKPEIWDSQDFMDLTPAGESAFFALITLSDDEGRKRTDARHLRITAVRKHSVEDIEEGLRRMEEFGMLRRYMVDGKSYTQLVNWHHQRVDHPSPSNLPGPDHERACPLDSSREIAKDLDSSSLARAQTGSDQTGPDRTGSDLLPAPLALVATAHAAESDEVGRVWLAWIESTGRIRTALTEQRRKLIKKQLKDYPVEDLVAAVRGWRHIPHNRGENDRSTVYNDIELLLKDAQHIERFRDAEMGDRPVAVPRVVNGRAAAVDARVRALATGGMTS